MIRSPPPWKKAFFRDPDPPPVERDPDAAASQDAGAPPQGVATLHGGKNQEKKKVRAAVIPTTIMPATADEVSDLASLARVVAALSAEIISAVQHGKRPSTNDV